MTRRIALWLGLLLVLTQSLGVWHGIAHGSGGVRVIDRPAQTGVLWADHELADCQLFHHAAQGDGLALSVSLSVPAPVTWTRMPGPALTVVVTGTAPYQSRAPPAPAVSV